MRISGYLKGGSSKILNIKITSSVSVKIRLTLNLFVSIKQSIFNIVYCGLD